MLNKISERCPYLSWNILNSKIPLKFWFRCVLQIFKEKVYITPQTIEVGTHHPPNYKTGCLTP